MNGPVHLRKHQQQMVEQKQTDNACFSPTNKRINNGSLVECEGAIPGINNAHIPDQIVLTIRKDHHIGMNSQTL